jgi:TfoX/Sxy family transcriptional regulator of competence genes
MAYDVELADRIRFLVGPTPGITERKMFGGLAFLAGGNMAVAASGQGGLLVRVDPAETEGLVSEAHVERMEMRGRAMDGWLRVAADAVDDDVELRRWVERGLAYARSLPPK